MPGESKRCICATLQNYSHNPLQDRGALLDSANWLNYRSRGIKAALWRGEDMTIALADIVRTVTANDALKPFFVGIDEDGDNRPTVTVHTVFSRSAMADRRRLQKVLQGHGVDAKCVVRKHSPRSLSKARSLASVVRPFAHDQVISDPTGSIVRASHLAEFATLMRSELADKLTGLYWQPRLQLLFVVLNHREYFIDGKASTIDLAAAEELVGKTLRQCLGGDASRYLTGVRIGFEVPATDLVALDDSSYFEEKRSVIRLQGKGLVAALTAMIGLGASASLAADPDVGQPPLISDPAVSATNFDIGLLGGVRDKEGIFIAEGAATLPLGHAFGMRIDGAAGYSNNEFVGGVAGHLFWRDPAVGLLGVQGGYYGVRPHDATSSERFGRVGAMGEVYVQDFTFLASAGYQFNGSGVEDGFYGRAGLEWFATDNLLFHVEGEYDPEREGLGRFGAEYLPGFEALPGLSFYGEAAIGNHDYGRVLGGIRMHFGPHGERTLKERYRYDTFRHTNEGVKSGDPPVGSPPRIRSGYPE